MTSVAMPRRRQSLLGKALEVLQRTPRARRRVAAVATAVRDHMTTVAAFAAFDYGVWSMSHAAAFMCAAPLLVLLEWKVRG